DEHREGRRPGGFALRLSAEADRRREQETGRELQNPHSQSMDRPDAQVKRIPLRRAPSSAVCGVVLAICTLAVVSCGSPKLKRVVGDWYVDDVAPGAPSPRLYWIKDGRRIVVDRQIRSIVHRGCLVYETARPSVAAVVFAVESGK